MSDWIVIPGEVWKDPDLTPNAKLLFGKLESRAYRQGYCDDSNNYLARAFKCEPEAISQWITQLKNKSYIKVEYEKKGKRIIRRLVLININTGINGGTNKYYHRYQQKHKERYPLNIPKGRKLKKL